MMQSPLSETLRALSRKDYGKRGKKMRKRKRGRKRY